MGVSKEGTAPRLSCVQDWSFVQGAVIRDVSDPSEQLFGHLFSNSSSFNLVNPHLLEIWIFWRRGNLNLAVQGASVTCSLFYSLVWMDIRTWPVWTLASALGLFRGTTHT